MNQDLPLVVVCCCCTDLWMTFNVLLKDFNFLLTWIWTHSSNVIKTISMYYFTRQQIFNLNWKKRSFFVPKLNQLPCLHCCNPQFLTVLVELCYDILVPGATVVHLLHVGSHLFGSYDKIKYKKYKSICSFLTKRRIITWNTISKEKKDTQEGFWSSLPGRQCINSLLCIIFKYTTCHIEQMHICT